MFWANYLSKKQKKKKKRHTNLGLSFSTDMCWPHVHCSFIHCHPISSTVFQNATSFPTREKLERTKCLHKGVFFYHFGQQIKVFKFKEGNEKIKNKWDGLGKLCPSNTDDDGAIIGRKVRVSAGTTSNYWAQVKSAHKSYFETWETDNLKSKSAAKKNLVQLATGQQTMEDFFRKREVFKFDNPRQIISPTFFRLLAKTLKRSATCCKNAGLASLSTA